MEESSRDDMLSLLPEGERELLVIQEQGSAAVRELDYLIWEYREFGRIVDTVKRLARQAVMDYNEDHDDESLARVEEFTDELETFTGYRKKLRVQIKEARERVRWLRNQYQTRKQQLKS